jgi:ABC-type uncharacterized transport system permease subunit
MELDVTWGRAVRVWWAHAWRSLVAVLVAMVIGAVVGGILGFAMGIMGAEVRTIRIVAGTIGFAIGLGVSVVPMKMILGKEFREFRLVLMAKQADQVGQGASHSAPDQAGEVPGRAAWRNA